jgi:hypothetical protein
MYNLSFTRRPLLFCAIINLLNFPAARAIQHFAVATSSSNDEQLIQGSVYIPANSTAVTVDYRTLSDTAIADVDFIPISGTFRFEPGQTEAKFEIQLINDSLVEGYEDLKFELKNPSGDFAPFTATIGLPDNDRGYYVYGRDAPENEGFLDITVVRFGNFGYESTVEIRPEPPPTTPGSPFRPAQPGVDYVDQTFNVHFAAGTNLQQTVRLVLLNNSNEDGDRLISIGASNPLPACRSPA